MLNLEIRKLAHRRLLRCMKNGGTAYPETWVAEDGYLRVEFVGGNYDEYIVEPGLASDWCLCLYENGVLQGAWGIEEAII